MPQVFCYFIRRFIQLFILPTSSNLCSIWILNQELTSSLPVVDPDPELDKMTMAMTIWLQEWQWQRLPQQQLHYNNNSGFYLKKIWQVWVAFICLKYRYVWDLQIGTSTCFRVQDLYTIKIKDLAFWYIRIWRCRSVIILEGMRASSFPLWSSSHVHGCWEFFVSVAPKKQSYHSFP